MAVRPYMNCRIAEPKRNCKDNTYAIFQFEFYLKKDYYILYTVVNC